MTTESTLPKKKLPPHILIKQLHFCGWNWRTAGAICGLGLGIISPLFGSVLTAISWFTGPHWHGLSLQRDGTVLLFLTIPFLILGGLCLDLADKAEDEVKKRHLGASQDM